MVSSLLFERPWLLLILLVAINFISIAVWSRRRTQVWARIVWSGLAAIPLLVLVSLLVVTPSEQIILLCRDLAEMVDDGDMPGIAQYLAEDFVAGELDRSDFLDRTQRRLTEFQVDAPRLRRFEVEFSGKSEAVVVFDAFCTVRSVDTFVARLPSRWRLTLRREATGWRITQLEALSAPLSPISNLGDLLP